MKTNDRFLGLLGIAFRAGRLVLGADAAGRATEERKTRLLLLSEGLSRHTAGTLRVRAEQNGVKVVSIRRTMDELESALGKHTGVIAVTDAGFAKALLALCAKENEEESIYAD